MCRRAALPLAIALLACGLLRLVPALVPGTSGPAPAPADQVSFFHVADRADRVAFVADPSGSALMVFDGLRVELRRSVDSLGPEQSFNILLFGRGGQWLDPRHALAGTPEAKARTRDFLDRYFVGGDGGDPVRLLGRALDQRPDVLYLLTDGDFGGDGNEAVLRLFRGRAAGGQRTRVHAFAYVADPADLAALDDLDHVRALRAIAAATGGTFSPIAEPHLEP